MLDLMTARPESVLFGRDTEALDALLKIHSPTQDPFILDCTYNSGKMWKDRQDRVISSDIDSTFPVWVVADFMALPFRANLFDVVVFDPPHLPVAGASQNSSGIWERQYGITGHGIGRTKDNVSGMFAPFLKESKRVLKPEGIVLAKLADIVHNHRYQWHLVDFINAVRETEMTPCDLLIKRDPCGGNLKSSKWQRIHHLKRVHSYWIVVRNGTRCEAKR